MNNVHRILAMLAVAAGAAAVHAGAPAPAFNLTILHNNDGESQLINAGAGSLADYGGVARFRTLVDTLKASAATYPSNGAPNGVVLISSGDNFLAGPELDASLNISPLLPMYDSIAMSLVGYDACTIGNHEFDSDPICLSASSAASRPRCPSSRRTST
jgi:2',3'-cyclic-nucleotide 2'-phosphodiesterase (5'-nucleotidase family)